MPRLYHDEFELLSAEEVERVYRVTDGLELHRDWVVLPLNCAREGLELLMPDGKLLLRAPGGSRFEPWLGGLKDRLGDLELNRIPRRSVDDPKRELTGPGEPRFVGTHGYLDLTPGQAVEGHRP